MLKKLVSRMVGGMQKLGEEAKAMGEATGRSVKAAAESTRATAEEGEKSPESESVAAQILTQAENLGREFVATARDYVSLVTRNYLLDLADLSGLDEMQLLDVVIRFDGGGQFWANSTGREDMRQVRRPGVSGVVFLHLPVRPTSTPIWFESELGHTVKVTFSGSRQMVIQFPNAAGPINFELRNGGNLLAGVPWGGKLTVVSEYRREGVDPVRHFAS